MQSSRYLLTASLLTLSLLTAAAVLNFLVDPFERFRGPRWEGINLYKPEFIGLQRLSRPYVLTAVQPEVLVLGSSRAGEGMPCSHVPAGMGRCYNSSLAGATAGELARLVEHANARQNLRHVVLGLDFLSFINHQATVPPFEHDRLSTGATQEPTAVLQRQLLWLRDHIQLLLSTTALRASIRTVFGQGGELVSNRPALVNVFDDGSWSWVEGLPPLEHAELTRRYRGQFRYVYNFYLNRFAETAAANEGYADTLAMHLAGYRALLDYCIAQDIQLSLYISPEHISYQMAIMDSSRLQDYLDWRVAIGRETGDAFRSAGRQAPVIADFANNSPVTELPLPSPDKSEILDWFIDGSHHSRRYGSRIADYLFRAEPAAPAYRPEPLQATDMERVRTRIIEARARYERTNPADARYFRRQLQRFRQRSAVDPPAAAKINQESGQANHVR